MKRTLAIICVLMMVFQLSALAVSAEGNDYPQQQDAMKESLQFTGEVPDSEPEEIDVEETEIEQSTEPDEQQIDEHALDVSVSITPLAAAVFSGGGSGTSADPYQVRTAAQFSEIRNFMGSKACFKLMNDITIDGWFTPIGTSSAANFEFSGTLDGNHHTIYLYGASGTTGVGLFGYAENSVIKNLTLRSAGSYISGSQSRTGALVGNADNAVTIENCHVFMNISGALNTGGLVGYGRGVTIVNSSFSGSVSGTSYVGGLIGLSETNSSSGVTQIIKCNVSGSVYASDHGAGGLAGEFCGSINESYSACTVTTANSTAGGLIGSSVTLDGCSATITNSYSTGAVHANNGSYSGGIAGDLANASTKGWPSVRNCYTTCDVYVTSGYVGGITSRIGGSSSSCAEPHRNIVYSNIIRTSGTSSTNISRAYGNGYATTNDNYIAPNTQAYYKTSTPIPVKTDAKYGVTVSDAQLYDSSFYSSIGWDMSSIWELPAGSRCPVLRWTKYGNVSNPVASVASGTYNNPQTVTLSSTAGATIYYTLNGEDPVSSASRIQYTGPITVSGSVTLKAFAVKDGMRNSGVSTYTYTLKVAAPVANPPSGSDIYPGDSITLSCTTPGAQIYYTLDGTEPDKNGVLYTNPISITSTGTTTIKAYAAFSGMGKSDFIIYTYKSLPRVLAPVSDILPGVYSDCLSINLSASPAGASIYYTIDGSDPVTSPTRKEYTHPIDVLTSSAILAYAELNGYKSGIVSFEYIINNAITVWPYVFSFEGIEYRLANQWATELILVNAHNAYYTDIVIPESITLGDKVYTVTSYEADAFNGSQSLESLVLPQTIKTYKRNSFNECPNLKQVELRSPVNTEYYMFENCAALETVIFAEGTKAILGNAFKNCVSLREVYIPDGVEKIESNVFQGCASLSEILIPSSVAYIGSSAFEGCASLERVSISGSVTSIGSSCFSNCVELKEVVLPETLESIGMSAFSNCSALESIALPAFLQTIGDSVFRGCLSLREMVFPSGITSIGKWSFIDCPELSSLRFLGNTPPILTSAFSANTISIIYVPMGAAESYAPVVPASAEIIEE